MIKAVLIFLTFLVSCNSPQNNTVSGKLFVTKVIDGDTVRLSNGRTLRYIGIDTPETKIKQGRKFLYSPQPFAIDAKKLNEKLVKNKAITVEYDVEPVDKYDRDLGYCFADGIFVNAKLIEEGLAVTYTYPPNVKYTDLFVNLQQDARKNKKGLWGVYETINSSQAENYINQVRTVTGKVVSTSQSKKCLYLNFGTNYKEDFTVVIFKNSLQLFFDKGIQPQNFYTGKTVEVSGRIRKYNGPEIIVSTPGEIRVIESE